MYSAEEVANWLNRLSRSLNLPDHIAAPVIASFASAIADGRCQIVSPPKDDD